MKKFVGWLQSLVLSRPRDLVDCFDHCLVAVAALVFLPAAALVWRSLLA